MHHRVLLPTSLGDHFAVRTAAAVGVGRGRMAARDLVRPFHGVRAQIEPTTPLERVHALVPRLKPGELIGSSTALHIWGSPFPSIWAMSDDIVVAVATGASRPRARGVRGVRLAAGRVHPWRVGGIPLVDPLAALFMCAGDLSHVAIVTLLESMVTAADNYPGLRPGMPILTRHKVAARLREWGRFPGCARVRDALTAVRDDVESPKETETRLLLVAHGLPEPEVQYEIRRGGRVIARSDLAYPDLRIAIEYEGDGHRTDRSQWRRDIQRQRELEDMGWIVIRVTQLDLVDGSTALISRIRHALATRAESRTPR